MSSDRYWARSVTWLRTPRGQMVGILLAIATGIGAMLLVDRFRSEPASVAAKPAEAEHTDEHEEEPGKPVTLTEAEMTTAQIQVEQVRLGAPGLVNAGLEVPAQVEFDPRSIALVSPRTDGRIERLTVVEGDRVRAGQVVALLYSKEYLVAQSDLQQAARRAAMLSDGPDAAGVQALLQAARRRLTLLGVPAAEIRRIEGGREQSLYLGLAAPLNGSVVKSHVLSGQAVHAGDPVFTVADMRVVDVVAEIPEQSLPLVRIDQAATVSVAAYPETPFSGRVERLRNELNPETRTVRAVIHVSNSAGRLRPGMFATVRLQVPGSAYQQARAPGDTTTGAALTIPESAVVTDGAERYVFVLVAPRTFERRAVEIAPIAPPGSSVVNSAWVVVRNGLKVGESVVTRGAFTLKSELAKAGLGEHGH